MPVPVLDADLPSAISSPARHESFWVAGWRRLRRRKLAMASFVFIAAMIILSLLTPKIAPYPFDVPTSETFQQPSLRHWFGTDLHGRDVFTRVLYGGRLSLLVGFVATVVSLSIGVLYGAIAGYAGGKIDNAMMRLVDILYSLPHLVFVIVLISFLEDYLKRFLEHDWFGLTRAWIPDTRILLLLVGLGVLQWLTMARIVRGQVLSLREQQFVLASRALGARAPRIILRHLIPNVTGPVLVYLTLTIPA
ncbi:MAG: ABC transporter permease, partial [Verrucomicrobiae bacterium]|nr:ABC transporter permease [Verrucomicrobiae bacterium]